MDYAQKLPQNCLPQPNQKQGFFANQHLRASHWDSRLLADFAVRYF